MVGIAYEGSAVSIQKAACQPRPIKRVSQAFLTKTVWTGDGWPDTVEIPSANAAPRLPLVLTARFLIQG